MRAAAVISRAAVSTAAAIIFSTLQRPRRARAAVRGVRGASGVLELLRRGAPRGHRFGKLPSSWMR